METGIWTPNEGQVSVLCTYHIAYTYHDPPARLVTHWDWQKVRKLLDRTWPKKLPPVKAGPPQVWPRLSAFDTEYVPHVRKFLCYSLYDGRTLRVSEDLEGGLDLGSEMPRVIMHNAPADLPFLEEIRVGFEFEDTMLAHAVLQSDLDHDLGFLGSLYGSLNRWKHLDAINPTLYSAADAFITWEAWSRLANVFEGDPGSFAAYERQKRLVPIIMRAEERGIRVNPTVAKQTYTERLDRLQGLILQSQALTGWPINAHSNKQISQQLFEVDGLLRVLKVDV